MYTKERTDKICISRNFSLSLQSFLRRQDLFARMVKLVDTPDLGSGAERHKGSSPFMRTTFLKNNVTERDER